MRICCGSVCYRHQGLDECLAMMAEAGYKEVELVAIPTWIHVDLQAIDAEALQRRCEAAGLGLAALYPGGVNCTSPEATEQSVAYIQRAIDVAGDTGVGRIVFTGQGRDTAPLAAAIEGYKRLADYLVDKPVAICLENHYRNQIEFPDDYRQVFAAVDSPQFAMTIDTGHFTSSQVDFLALADEFADRLRHVHVKDHIGAESVPLGQGETDNAGLVRKLLRMGYDGYLSVEVEAKDHENNPRYAADALPYLQALVARCTQEAAG